MNLDEAVSCHLKWKIRLGMIIEGNSADILDPKEVEMDNRCELGKWLHGTGCVHQDQPEFAPLVAEHAAFHKFAAAVLRKAIHGNRPGAKADLEGPYQEHSKKVVLAILKLKKAIE